MCTAIMPGCQCCLQLHANSARKPLPSLLDHQRIKHFCAAKAFISFSPDPLYRNEQEKHHWCVPCRRTMMAFSSGGSQPPSPFLPGSLIGARLGFHNRRASDPFSGSGSRSSSSSHTVPGRNPEPQSLSGIVAAKSNRGGVKSSADLAMGPALSSASVLGYLRTASLPHVPTQPSLVPSLSQHTETPAMANPRESTQWLALACTGAGCDGSGV